MRDKIIKDEMLRDQITQARLTYEAKRVGILAGLADNFLFEYDKQEDALYFIKPIRLHDQQQVWCMRDCTKSKSLVPYIYPEDLCKVIGVLRSEEGGTIEFRCLTKEGYVWFQGTLMRVISEDERMCTYLGSLTNINKEKYRLSQRKQSEDIDDLTKLYSLSYMKQNVTLYLSNNRQDKLYAMILMDLIGFKAINEKFGYLFGDTILVQAARALSDVFYPNELIGRVGSDKFMVFVPEIKKREELFLKLDQVCKELSGIYTGEVKEAITAVFGVAMFPHDGMNFHELFCHADTACYVAKQKGYGNLMFYENCALHLKEPEKEFYSQYEVPRIRTFGHNNFDKDITTFTIDLMHKMNNVDHAIIVLLNHLVRVLNVDFVRIYEVSEDHNRLVQTYTSGTKHHITESNGLIYEEVGLQEYQGLFQNGFFSARNTKDIELLPLKYVLYERGVYATLQCAIYREGQFCGCISIEDHQQTRKWTEYEYSALYSLATIFSTYLLIMRDYEKAKEILDNLKDYDQLTKLLNISAFKREVEQVLQKANGDTKYAIVSTDFMHYKYVNERCGYEVGDQLLYEYARMLELFDRQVLLARESADRFLMLVMVDQMDELRANITEINEEFATKQKKRLLGWTLSIVAGICDVSSAKYVAEAIDHAIFARKSIKGVYATDTCIYNEKVQNHILHQLEIINRQEQALQNQEFQVYLQPKVELQDEKLVGAEALIRWRHSDGTIMYPDEFIPIFEQNGFIVHLDFFVYEKVCQVLEKWKSAWNLEIPISVNVSRVHLSDPTFVDKIETLMNYYKIPHHLLELELTESMVLDCVDSAIDVMNRLQEKGFVVSIDDFGAGYSSLNLLKDLKTDILKLDKDFFRQGDLQKKDKIIVSNIINMAKQLDMKVLSEGVETSMQSEFLRESSCDMAQGYLYAKPMPIADFEKFLKQHIERN